MKIKEMAQQISRRYRLDAATAIQTASDIPKDCRFLRLPIPRSAQQLDALLDYWESFPSPDES